MMLTATATPVARDVWTAAMAWLAPAIDRAGETDENEILRMINAGEAQLWTAWGSGVMRMALVTTRHGDTLHLWLCGGSGGDWAMLLRRLMAFAKTQGVTNWTVDGRKGWRRVLKEVA